MLVTCQIVLSTLYVLTHRTFKTTLWLGAVIPNTTHEEIKLELICSI